MSGYAASIWLKCIEVAREDAGIRAAACLIGILILTGHSARAGLYGPGEVSPFDANGEGVEELSFNSDGTGRFPLTYARVGNIADSRRSTPERSEHLKRIQETTQPPVARAADLIRTRQFDAAIQLLKPMTTGRATQFEVLANLAHAFAWKGEWSEAVRYHEAALLDAEFPTAIRNGGWLMKVEKLHYRRWLKLHEEEVRRPVRPAQEQVFPLFEGKPPADAIAIVQQLLLWAPDDNRLVWLLAELYTQAGPLRVAERLFDSLASQDRQQSNRFIMMEHRAAVKARVKELPPESEPVVVIAPTPAPPTGWQQLGISTQQLKWAAGLFALAAAVLIRFQFRKLLRRRGASP